MSWNINMINFPQHQSNINYIEQKNNLIAVLLPSSSRHFGGGGGLNEDKRSLDRIMWVYIFRADANNFRTIFLFVDKESLKIVLK